MMPKPILVDTGSGYNVIRQDALPPGWKRHITHSADLPALGDANNNSLFVRHEVQMRTRLGDATYPVRFIVVNRLACPVFLGTHFLDQHVDAIKCSQRVLYLTRSIVPILGVGKAGTPHRGQQAPDITVPEPKMNRRDPKKPPTSARIRLCRLLRLPPFTQVKANVVTQSGGLVHTEPRHSVYQEYQVRASNGVHEVIPEEPFELLLSNFSKVERKFPKGMVIAYAAPSPLALIPLAGKAAKETAQVLNIAPIKVGAATAPLTQEDLEQAAPDTEVQPRGPRAEHEVGPVITQIAPAPPEGAGPVRAPSGAPLPKDWKDLVDLSHITDENLKARIWQVPIAERDRDKTTFTSHMGTVRYKRVPFGLRNAPATFQRALDIILSGVRWKTCLVYIDDVVIFSKTEEEHFAQVSHVFTLLEEAGVKLKLNKCFFFHQRVEYLGHVITPGRLSVANDAKDTCAVREATFHGSITQLRGFIGACNVYRRFVKDYSKIASPLSDMLRKNVGNDWYT